MMTAAPLHLAGHRLLLDPLGAVIWPGEQLIAVADLHFEKGTAAARRGQLVPPWDTTHTLDRLDRLLHTWRPQTVVTLGDTFHDIHGPARMAPGDAARLRAMAHQVRFIWVGGNHDPVSTHGLPGLATPEWTHDGLTFRHEARQGADAELCGHHHPKAAVPTRAGRVSRPCFVTDAHRIMLPAMGAYTGGLDVTHPAIARLFPRGGRAFLLGQGRLFSFPLSVFARGSAPIPADAIPPRLNLAE